MEENQITKLVSLSEAYQKVRNEKLATGIIIKTLTGDLKIKNPAIVTAVLDFLIHELNEQVKQKVNE